MANPDIINPYTPPRAGLDKEPVIERTHVLAGHGQRLGAMWIDNFVMVLPCIAVAALCAAVGLTGQAGFMEPAIIGSICLVGGSIGIYQWYLVATTGQSLGKRWLKIKIVKSDGEPVDFVSGVVLRRWPLYAAIFIASFVGTRELGNFVFLIDALFIFGRERRTLHDRIAGTKVISVALPV